MYIALDIKRYNSKGRRTKRNDIFHSFAQEIFIKHQMSGNLPETGVEQFFRGKSM